VVARTLQCLVQHVFSQEFGATAARSVQRRRRLLMHAYATDLAERPIVRVFSKTSIPRRTGPLDSFLSGLDRKLLYGGKIQSGFTQQEAQEIREALDPFI